MKRLADTHPFPVFLYFLCVTLTAMFCMNPVVILLSCAGAVSLFYTALPTARRRAGRYFAVVALLLFLLNPLFNHRGKTVWLIVNGRAVTAEATLYGAVSAAALLAVLYWFGTFSYLMTSDRLLYLFGKLSPRFSLTLSLALRYIPLLGEQSRRIRQTQKALGLYREDTVIRRLQGERRVFSALATWVLENGIITADSMAARGYHRGRRTCFVPWRFRRADACFLAATLLLTAVAAWCLFSGAWTTVYYPDVLFPAVSGPGLAGYIAYGLLAVLPTILEGKEAFRWKYCLSKR